MSAATVNSRKTASPKPKGEAAREETADAPRTVDFRGVTLTIPSVLPGSLYFDFADLEDNQDSPAAQVRLLRSLVGADQLRQVREKIIADKVTFDEVDEVMVGLFNDVLDVYGMGLGESSASPES